MNVWAVVVSDGRTQCEVAEFMRKRDALKAAEMLLEECLAKVVKKKVFESFDEFEREWE